MKSPSNRQNPRKKAQPPVLRELCAALESKAPISLAQSWDNAGLLAGDLDTPVQRVLLCIDLTPAVMDEAVTTRVQLVVAYHPPIFKPINRLVRPGTGTDALVHRCIASGVAIYSPHTALDAAEGGTNDVVAGLCGIIRTDPLESADAEAGPCKVVVFVPAENADRVADAMFAAGAGRIGDYERCSFRIPGSGTFFGLESTHPVVGEAGRLERVEELRMEAVCPQDSLPEVIGAIRGSHPYEEPAFDIYPLKPAPRRGIGRIGMLAKPCRLSELARKLKRLVPAPLAAIVGDSAREVRRAIIVVGAAGSLPFKLPPRRDDVIITGELRHHDALAIRRLDCSAIALSHWASERPVLEPFAGALREKLSGVEVMVSRADADPFTPIP